MPSKFIYFNELSVKPHIYEKCKTISNNNLDHIPFTYLIGWSGHDLWYYGVRYANKCNPLTLWTTYFTSSKRVNYLRSELGEPDIIQIRNVFSDPAKAREFEHKILKNKKLNVVKNKKWINASDSNYLNEGIIKIYEEYGVTNISQLEYIKEKKRKTTTANYGVDNPMKSNEIRNKAHQTNLLRYGVKSPAKNEQIKQKMKDTTLQRYGVENAWQSEEIKSKIKDIFIQNYGVDHPMKDPEIKAKNIEKLKEIRKTRPKRKCPYCEVESRNYTNMTRYHFENCKSKK